MADIEDEVEFEEMLRFVLDQWRNVRQRKSVPRRKSEDGDESQGDEQCGHGEKEDADKQIPVRTFTEDEIKAEFNISSSEDEEASQSGFQSNMYGRVSPSQGGKVKIRLNPKAKKDPFYTLPEKLLDACMKLLPVSNTANHAISIDESQHSQDTGSAQLQGSVETIWIKHVGNFSRAQIETFKRVHNLMEVVKLGLDTHKWLVQEGIFSLPAEYHAVATSVADEILSTYPRRESRAFPTSLISSMRCSTEFLLQHGYQMPQ
ncbi:hypothetical protein F443_11912 [Phytophthora nicotianae P1569]|uniref:Uncharacterized protein n=1 Tax=Phytophthora nicotianae P1569 TaxID=1317065 RepID=V9EVZ5_PHYNI|nr:hypothetical protein F443_11912 [Phytophthora nicotianae P1569]